MVRRRSLKLATHHHLDQPDLVLVACSYPLILVLCKAICKCLPALLAHLGISGAAAVAVAFVHMSLLCSFIEHSGVLWPVLSGAHLARGCVAGEYFGQDVVIYAVLLLISSLIYYQLVSRRTQLQKLSLEPQLTSAQLQALQSQVQPHFLSNAHNAVLSLIDLGRNPETAEALSHLNAILRSSLLR